MGKTGREGSRGAWEEKDLEGFEEEIMMMVTRNLCFFNRLANLLLSQIDSIDKAFLNMVETWAALATRSNLGLTKNKKDRAGKLAVQ